MLVSGNTTAFFPLYSPFQGSSVKSKYWQEVNIRTDTKPNASTIFEKKHFHSYGLGWFLSDRNGFVIVEHTGGLPGMLSNTILIPELNVGILVLTNTDPGGFSFYSMANFYMVFLKASIPIKLIS
ncbi:beta-lactamase family protein [Cyclobacterium sp. SYSU L10401]|uniref:beta-lactamase family protein n=1 Tax=Cyclobacterium sp. SYSU L10401 TaxID=2678657 RepID=UPI001F0959C3|nr:beta-lactamase family protein [Cyclobacterium sp. SYSU L10401]